MVSQPPPQQNHATHLPRAFYIEGPLGSGKTSLAVKHVLTCLHQTPSENILVLCSNHSRQQQFSQRLLAKLAHPIGQSPVYTYAGFIRQTLMDNWPVVEAFIGKQFDPTKDGQPQVRPILCGFEITERLLANLINQYRVSHPDAFADFPGNDTALIRQLIRRLRLRAENRLTRQEMLSRSEKLATPCLQDIAHIEKALDALTTRLRMLDSSRQLELFHTLLAHSPDVQAYLRHRTQHLIAEDLDETIPAQQQFIQWVAGQSHCQSVCLTVDINGGSRRGYLNAYPYDWPALKAIRTGKTQQLQRVGPAASTANRLLSWWKKQSITADPQEETTLQATRLHPNRVAMLTAVCRDINRRHQQGHPGSSIAIVLPMADDWTAQWLSHQLKRQGHQVQSLIGGTSPNHSAIARALLSLAQWCYYPGGQTQTNPYGWPLSPNEWQNLWFTLCPHWYQHPKGVEHLILALNNTQQHKFDSQTIPDWQTLAECHPSLAEYATQLQAYYQHCWAECLSCQRLPFIDGLYQLFINLITPTVWPKRPVLEIDQLLHSATQYHQLAQRWETLAGEPVIHPPIGKAWLQQVKAGVVADTPAQPMGINPDAIIIGTPQKLIDMTISRPWMAWLDVSSRQWARTDSAPLYNAWVHSAMWNPDDPNIQEQLLDDGTQQRLVRLRAGHLTRTLALLATETIQPYASQQDDDARDIPNKTGQHLIDGLEAIRSNTTKPTTKTQRATLRDDQKGVLDYGKKGMGTMAIAAVPGAGKTFVNVELILELVNPASGQPGIPADAILILTYMDSAARTLQTRLQQKLQTAKLPTVSTIHGLAFRILTEDDHFRHFSQLPEELAIMDDYEQQLALQDITGKIYTEKLQQAPISQRQFTSQTQRAIMEAKYARLSPDDLAHNMALADNHSPIYQHLANAYKQYNQYCLSQGKLDFTDLILYAIQLLEERPDIRTRYQQQYQVIIEDEAQDSSSLLQQFITLLSGSNPNLIRTGDTNQSITTTFSAADPSVFREFTATAQQSIHMYRSGRCAPEVMAMANDWLAHCLRDDRLHQAFVPITMKPVDPAGAYSNPTLIQPIRAKSFPTDLDEQRWWIGEIHRWQQDAATNSRKDTMALLLSRNDQVLAYTKALQQAGIPAISLTEAVQEQAVFAIQRGFINLLSKPNDLATQAEWVTILKETGLLFLPPFVDPGEAHNEATLVVELAWLDNNALLSAPINALPTPTLTRLAYDCQEFQQLAIAGDMTTLLIAIAHRYFDDANNRSNGILCALTVKRHLAELSQAQTPNANRIGSQLNSPFNMAPIELTAALLNDLHRGRKLRRAFGDTLDDNTHGLVQVMTLHKSKGQEFDRVGMVGLVSEDFKASPEDELAAIIRGWSQQQSGQATPVTKEALIQDKANERARLMYVGISRAKRDLVLTTSKSVTKFGKQRPSTPAGIFTFAENWLNTASNSTADQPVITRETLEKLVYSNNDDEGAKNR